MGSTKVLSARVTMDSYVQILEWAKCENLIPSDYVISAIYGYENYKRDCDRAISSLINRLGLDSSKMTIDEKMLAIETEFKRQELEIERVKKLSFTSPKKVRKPKANIAFLESKKTANELMVLELEKVNIALQGIALQEDTIQVIQEPLIKHPKKTKKAESKLRFVNFSKH